jgi:uncharacterized protein (TIGR03083 family)
MLDFAELLSAETERLAALVVSVEPTVAVPSCPEWTVRDLVTHVGRGHRWATGLVAARATAAPPFDKSEAPPEPAAWPGWLDDGTRALVTAVAEAGPDCRVWTWRTDKTAGFWLRRMLHDELVHRADAQLAVGQPPDLSAGVSAELAVDGVDDWLETVAVMSASGGWHPTLSKLAGTGQTLHLHATDTQGEWFVRREPGGVTWHRGHERADVALRGPIRPLLLVLNRRLGAEHLEILGERTVLDEWLAHSQF